MYKTLGFLGIACFLVLLIAAGCSTTSSTSTLPNSYTIMGTLNQGSGTYETAVVLLSPDQPDSSMQIIESTGFLGTFEGSPGAFTYSMSYSTDEAAPREYYVFAMSPEDWDEDGQPPYMAWAFITLEANTVVTVDAITLQ